MVLFRTAQTTLFRAKKTIKNNCQCSQWPCDKSRNMEESFVSLLTIDWQRNICFQYCDRYVYTTHHHWQRNICFQYSINISTPLLVFPITLEKSMLKAKRPSLFVLFIQMKFTYVHILRNSYICKKTKAKDVFVTITASKQNIKLWVS